MLAVAASPLLGGLVGRRRDRAPVGDAARPRVLPWFPLIGGAVWTRLVALGAAVVRARSVLVAALGSLFAWAIVDSGWGLWSGGAFNVLVINLPTLVLLSPPLLLAWWRAPQ
jgi:hypothetical protein